MMQITRPPGESKRGIETPTEEIEKIRSRLREAEKDYAEWTAQKERGKETRL